MLDCISAGSSGLAYYVELFERAHAPHFGQRLELVVGDGQSVELTQLAEPRWQLPQSIVVEGEQLESGEPAAMGGRVQVRM